MDKELDELRQILKQVQEAPSAKQISRRNVLSLIHKLFESYSLDAVRTLSGDELVTSKQLKIEILTQLQAGNGFVAKKDLPELLDVDSSVLEPLYKDVAVLSTFIVQSGKSKSSGLDDDLLSDERVRNLILDLGEIRVEEGFLFSSKWTDSIADTALSILACGSTTLAMVVQPNSSAASSLSPYLGCLLTVKLAEAYSLPQNYVQSILIQRLLSVPKTDSLLIKTKTWDIQERLKTLNISSVQTFGSVFYTDQFVNSCHSAVMSLLSAASLPMRLSDVVNIVHSSLCDSYNKPRSDVLPLLEKICLQSIRTLITDKSSRAIVLDASSTHDRTGPAGMKRTLTQIVSETTSSKYGQTIILPELYILAQEKDVLKTISINDYLLFTDVTQHMGLLGDVRTYIKVLCETGQGALARGRVLSGCFVTAHLRDSLTDELRTIAEKADMMWENATSSKKERIEASVLWASCDDAESLVPEVAVLPREDIRWLVLHCIGRLAKQTGSNLEPHFYFADEAQSLISSLPEDSLEDRHVEKYIMTKPLVRALSLVSRLIGGRISFRIKAVMDEKITEGRREDFYEKEHGTVEKEAFNRYDKLQARISLQHSLTSVVILAYVWYYRSFSKETIEDFDRFSDSLDTKQLLQKMQETCSQYIKTIINLLVHAEQKLDQNICDLITSEPAKNSKEIFQSLPKDVVQQYLVANLALIFSNHEWSLTSRYLIPGEYFVLDILNMPPIGDIAFGHYLSSFIKQYIQQGTEYLSTSSYRRLSSVVNSMRSAQQTSEVGASFSTFLARYGIPAIVYEQICVSAEDGFLKMHDSLSQIVFHEYQEESKDKKDSYVEFDHQVRRVLLYIASGHKLLILVENETQSVFDEILRQVPCLIAHYIDTRLLNVAGYTGGLESLLKLRKNDEIGFKLKIKDLSTRVTTSQSSAISVFKVYNALSALISPDSDFSQSEQNKISLKDLFSVANKITSFNQRAAKQRLQADSLSIIAEDLVAARSESIRRLADKNFNDKDLVIHLGIELVFSRLTGTYLPFPFDNVQSLNALLALADGNEIIKTICKYLEDHTKSAEAILSKQALLELKKRIISVLGS